MIKIITLCIGIMLYSTIYSQTSEIKTFWKEFKSAVIAKDTLKVSTMVKFSNTSGLIGTTKSGFYTNFNSIFDKKTIDLMIATENLKLTESGDYLFTGSGAYKFFHFKKIAGKYKLYNVMYYD